MTCDLEAPAVYREIIRKARKVHVCSDCKGIIQPGERYTYVSGIWDGKPDSFHQCQDCKHLRCEIKRDTEDEDCIYLGGLRVWIEESVPYTTDETHPWFRWRAMFNAYAKHRQSPIFIEKPEL